MDALNDLLDYLKIENLDIPLITLSLLFIFQLFHIYQLNNKYESLNNKYVNLDKIKGKLKEINAIFNEISTELKENIEPRFDSLQSLIKDLRASDHDSKFYRQMKKLDQIGKVSRTLKS